jgi:hypothetical protein
MIILHIDPSLNRRGIRARRAKRATRDALWAISDRLCTWSGTRSDAGVTHLWLFELGHQIGELGWKLREPR